MIGLVDHLHDRRIERLRSGRRDRRRCDLHHLEVRQPQNAFSGTHCPPELENVAHPHQVEAAPQVDVEVGRLAGVSTHRPRRLGQRLVDLPCIEEGRHDLVHQTEDAVGAEARRQRQQLLQAETCTDTEAHAVPIVVSRLVHRLRLGLLPGGLSHVLGRRMQDVAIQQEEVGKVQFLEQLLRLQRPPLLLLVVVVEQLRHRVARQGFGALLAQLEDPLRRLLPVETETVSADGADGVAVAACQDGGQSLHELRLVELREGLHLVDRRILHTTLLAPLPQIGALVGGAVSVAPSQHLPECRVPDDRRAAIQHALTNGLDHLPKQHEVEQFPALRHDDVRDGPVVVAIVEGDFEDALGQVDRAPRAPRVHGAPVAHVAETQHARADHEGDGDVARQQGIEEVLG